MSLMKKKLDEINTIVETYLRPIEEDTGKRKVCMESVNEKMRTFLINHGNLNQPLDPRWFK